MKSILRHTLVLALAGVLALNCSSTFAADAQPTGPQQLQKQKNDSSGHTTAPVSSSVFLLPNSGAVHIGSLTMAPNSSHTDLNQTLAALNNSQWRAYGLMINKENGIHTTLLLIPTGDSKFGIISLNNLALKNTEKTLVDSISGTTFTFIYTNQGLNVKVPGSGEIVIASEQDLKKAQASIKSGASATNIAAK